MNHKQSRETSSDVRFKNTVCKTTWNVRTQDVDKAVTSWDEIKDYILDVFADANQFVTLTAGNIFYNVRYVQATQADGGIIVQAGIEEADHTRLVETLCTAQECLDIFKEFYTSTHVQDLEAYIPVKFYV